MRPAIDVTPPPPPTPDIVDGGGQTEIISLPQKCEPYWGTKGGYAGSPPPPIPIFSSPPLGTQLEHCPGGAGCLCVPPHGLAAPPMHWAQCWDPSAYRYWGGPTVPPPHRHPQPPLRCWGGGTEPLPSSALCQPVQQTRGVGGGTPSAATSPPSPGLCLPWLMGGNGDPPSGGSNARRW